MAMDFIGIDPGAFQKQLNLIEAGRQQRANTDATIAQTEERKLATEVKTDAFKRQQSFLGRIAGLSPAALASTNPPLVPGVDTPDATTELAQANGETTPKAAPKNLMELSKQQKPWEKDFADADRNDMLARAAEESGLLTEANKYRDDARASRKQGVEAQQNQTKIDVKAWTKAYDMASSVRDDNSFQYVMSQLNGMNPGTAEQLGFRKGSDGRYVFDDDAVAKVASIKQLALTEKDRLEFEAKAATLAEQAERRKLDEKKAEDLANYRDQLHALKQAGQEAKAKEIEAKIKQLEATNALKDAKQVEAITKTVQATMDKNDSVKLFPKYEQGFNTARMIYDQIKADTKYKDIDAPQIDSLKQAYQNMASGFRARAGGKWEQQNIEKFNGLTQKVEKWLATIGKGTPALNRTTAIQVYEAMEDMYAVAGAEALKTEMEGRRAARVRGGDPHALQYRAYGDEGLRNLLARKGAIKLLKKDETGLPLEVEIAGKKFDVSKDREDE